MRRITIVLLTIAWMKVAWAQPQTESSPGGAAASSSSEVSGLPVEVIGNDDLIGITVYDAPELSHAVRVDPDGDIRLPMLQKHIHASGLYPAQLESAVTAALITGKVLVDPIVTVTVVEYRSRPITIVGAVRSPGTFQAAGTITLLDAISRAGGLSESAGSEILISHQPTDAKDKSGALIQRISVRGLLNGEDPALNLHLQGGEEIRVPEAGRVYVLGRVKRPGTFIITDGLESSVMKAVALSDGLDSFPSHKAYIYRVEGGSGSRSEIPVELKSIMDRKSPDVALMANDILYIPDATGARAGLKVLEATAGFGTAAGLAFLTVYR
jgi:polysaccharide export outer membrane protein